MRRLVTVILVAWALAHPAWSGPSIVIPTGASPKSVTISPDGRLAYVMNLEACSISVFDTATRKRVRTILFPQTSAPGWDYKKERAIPSVAEKPVDAAFSRDGRQLWVSLHNAASVVVFVVDGRGFAPAAHRGRTMRATVQEADGRRWTRTMLRIPTGRTPKVVRTSPDGRLVAVSNWHSDSVTMIDAHSYRVVATLKVPGIPRGLAFSKDGRRLYVAIMGGNQVEVFSTSRFRRAAVIARVGVTPRDLVLDREGRTLYASCNLAGSVTRMDTSTGKAVAQVRVGAKPRSLAFSPDEKYLYACCYDSHKVYVVDLQRFKVVGTLRTGENPVGIAVTPSGDVWVTNQGSDSVTIIPASKDAAVVVDPPRPARPVRSSP